MHVHVTFISLLCVQSFSTLFTMKLLGFICCVGSVKVSLQIELGRKGFVTQMTFERVVFLLQVCTLVSFNFRRSAFLATDVTPHSITIMDIVHVKFQLAAVVQHQVRGGQSV